MKALIQKELKENLKVGLLGLVVMAGLVVLNYRLCIVWDAVSGNAYQTVQPLVAEDLGMHSCFFCAIFGVLLGWLQVHREHLRDLRAFLLHRPVTRTQIFFGKIAAGLMVYILATGLPLLGMVMWSAFPGNVSAPFEWRMALPTLTYLGTGIGYYFAGMVIGLRQARWYASRALAIGLPVFVSMGVMQFEEFWQAAIAVVSSVLILATAAWGSWQTDGVYRNQPVIGKMAFALSIVWGAFIVTLLTGASVLTFVRSPPDMREHFSRYWMTPDGKILKQSIALWAADRPVGGAGSGDAFGIGLDLPDDGKNGRTWNRSRTYQAAQTFYRFWTITEPTAHSNNKRTLWYYWERYGRLVGFDIATRRPIGSLGPDGFSVANPMPPESFSCDVQPDIFHRVYPEKRFAGGAILYGVDFERRSVAKIFSSDPDEAIAAAAEVTLSEHAKLPPQMNFQNRQDVDYNFVATRGFAYLLTPDGRMLWKRAIEPGYTHLVLWCLDKSGQFGLMTSPQENAKDAGSAHNPPTRVVWLNKDGGIVKQEEFPTLPRHYVGNSDDVTAGVLAPPAMLFVINTLMRQEMSSWMIFLSLTVGLFCAVTSWWMGQRHQRSFAACLIWAPFFLICGIPGFLTYLSVQEWPALEKCQSCGKLRAVDVEHCPHCHAAFPPSATDGTEIFEMSR